jgi:hypothetical protein
MKLKNLKKKVCYYADLLSVRHLLRDVIIDKGLDYAGRTSAVHNTDICDVLFKKFDDVTIIHEMLHCCFKNTWTIAGKMMSKKAFKGFAMIHEQEVERLAISLAKIIPYKSRNNQ